MRPVSSTLRGTDQTPASRYDVALLDLDGVVYVGKHAVPGAPEALAAARSAGMQLAFVTNNAARPPATVAEHLTELGIAAEAGEVITSSQAAARYLSEQLPSGSLVLVLGTTGLYEALAERGLATTDKAGHDVAAVVQGYSPQMDWPLLAEGAVAINAGALWVATNVDPTVPSPRGPLPGNGSLVAAMRLATRKEPVITGKPDPTMHRETLLRTGARAPIVVGDRLDTDIEGANAVGCPSLLVFSGVTDVPDLLAAPPALRPTYLGADVGALLRPHPQPERESAGARCGSWVARRETSGLRLAASGEVTAALPDGTAGPDESTLDAIRALCAAWWDGGDGVDGEAPEVVAADEAAAAVLRALQLA